ncbi:hypothetical protein V6N13_088536 [Hibiscus sabdariffa]
MFSAFLTKLSCTGNIPVPPPAQEHEPKDLMQDLTEQTTFSAFLTKLSCTRNILVPPLAQSTPPTQVAQKQDVSTVEVRKVMFTYGRRKSKQPMRVTDTGSQDQKYMGVVGR